MINHLTDSAISWIVNKLKWLWLEAVGFNATNTTVSADGNTITQTNGVIKVVTVMETDNKVVEKLYVNNVLKSTKTTTISADDTNITEVIN